MRLNTHTYWLLFFALCVLFLFINLEFLPVVWLDEVMDLEPVGRWFLTGKHASIAWPMQGCEQNCMVNLPLRELPHFIAILIFGPSIWGLRFVFLLFYLLAGFGFFKCLQALNISNNIAYFLVAVLFLDKGTLEMMRGCRPEIIEMVCISWGFLFLLKNRYFIASALFLSLAWIHPAVWIIAIGFWVYAFIKSSKREKAISVLIALGSLAFFWCYIGGDVVLFYKQFSMSAGAHVPNYTIFLKFFNHFYRRYLMYWKIEHWWVVLFILSHVWLFSKWKTLRPLARLCLFLTVATSIFWLISLMPNHRYSVALNLLLVLNFGMVLPQLVEKLNQKWIQLSVLAIVMFSFSVRAVLALAHREERNPHKAIAWMDEKLPRKNTLLLGESIGSYWSLKHKGTKFAHDTQPQNAKFDDFDAVFLLSRNQEYPVFAKYHIRENSKILGWQLKGKTYAGLCLYKVENKKIYNAIVKEGMKTSYFYD